MLLFVTMIIDFKLFGASVFELFFRRLETDSMINNNGFSFNDDTKYEFSKVQDMLIDQNY